MPTGRAQDNLRRDLMAATLADPMLFLRTFLPHWFTLPVPWAHRGILAILLRQTDFLLNFGLEHWPLGDYEWTHNDLDKIIRHFVWKEDPDDEALPAIPLFALREEEGKPLRLELSLTDKTQVVWPRGFGKTTLINAANIIKVVFRLRKFLVYASESATHAEMQISNIKGELSSNQALISVFGQQKPERADDEVWRNDFFETLGGVAVMAKGRNAQIRGLLHKNNRPDDITIDDVEDLESVKTPEQRLKTKTWFKADVEPAQDQIAKSGTITMIGTMLHREALIPTIMGDPDWVTVRFGALDPDGDPLWKEYMTKEEFEKKKLSFTRAGMLSNFYMEYMSTLVNSEDAKFKGPFTYMVMLRTEFVAVAEVIDPAIGTLLNKPDSAKADLDYCAIGITGITSRGQHHILEVDGAKGWSPRDQIERYFDLHFKWDPTHHGVESNAYQAALVHIMREEMFRKAKKHGSKAYFEITPIIQGQKKIPRVEGVLAPRFSAGYVTMQRVFPRLEQQLLDWPNGKLDYPDVVAMCITLLDPYAAAAFDPTTLDEAGNVVVIDDVLARDVYEPLDEELWSAP